VSVAFKHQVVLQPFQQYSPTAGHWKLHILLHFSLRLLRLHGVRHPQHTQTSSNSFTIAADSRNGVTNTRCCRYGSMRSWWYMEVPPETCRAVSRYK